jgi:hypothetical protein
MVQVQWAVRQLVVPTLQGALHQEQRSPSGNRSARELNYNRSLEWSAAGGCTVHRGSNDLIPRDAASYLTRNGRISEGVGNFPILMDCHNCVYRALAYHRINLRHRDAGTGWESNGILLLMEGQNRGETLVLAKTVARLYSWEEPTDLVGYIQEVALGFLGGHDKCQQRCSRRTTVAIVDFSSSADHPDYIQGEMDHMSWSSST